MSGNFFTVLIDGEIVRLEKSRVMAIEAGFNGTKIILEASHTEEEPLIYFSPEPYEEVLKSYSS